MKRLILFLLTLIFLFTALTYLETNSGIKNQFSLVSKHNKDIDETKAVSLYCENKDSDIEKIHCVNDYVIEMFKYNHSAKIKNILEMQDSGGDCKGYSVFYSSVFDLLGFDNDYIFTTGHVFNIVYSDDFYCNIDMKIIDCMEYVEGDIN